MTSKYSTYKEASERARELAKEGASVSLRRDGDAWIVSVASSSNHPKPGNESNSIWVGKFEETGATVVFDTAVKFDGVDDVFGYVPARDVMRQFKSEFAKSARMVSGGEKDMALSKYLDWKQKHGTTFAEGFVTRKERAINNAIKKHKKYLKKIGKEYSGVNPNTSKRHRVTHCYACKEPLDSSFHIECNQCEWLVCECGACGCGYSL